MHLSQNNGYFANVFGLAKRGSSNFYLIRANHSTLNSSTTFEDEPIVADRKDICYIEIRYDSNTHIWTRKLTIYSADDGSLIGNTINTDTVVRKIDNHQNEWCIGGYSIYNQFPTYLIYQSILHKRALTSTELADSVTFLTNKWKDA